MPLCKLLTKFCIVNSVCAPRLVSTLIHVCRFPFLLQRKCIQYWPPEEDEELMFGDVKVKTDRISTLPDYVIRELDVRKVYLFY